MTQAAEYVRQGKSVILWKLLKRVQERPTKESDSNQGKVEFGDLGVVWCEKDLTRNRWRLSKLTRGRKLKIGRRYDVNYPGVVMVPSGGARQLLSQVSRGMGNQQWTMAAPMTSIRWNWEG